MWFRWGRPNFLVVLVLVVFILTSLHESNASAVPRRTFRVVHLRRAPQNEPSTTLTNQEVLSTATSLTSASEETEATTATASPTNSDSQSQDETTSVSIAASTSSTDADPEDATRPVYTGGLPLKPRIAPASIIAGIFMMILGFTSCIAAIKIKRLYIFLSTALLCGAAVSALIIYIMNPPVKTGALVGYVIAAVATGFICGGLAIVFPDFTENLPCLFGGFSFAMWLLCLKSGGLIEPVYGKVILIAVVAIGLFSLSFYHLLKPFVLIFSMVFGGTVVGVLGIDCFSRAGLKEMWVYIWGLNDKIFPYKTNTYPHTRGIKVELVVIALVALVGILAHIKLWTMTKGKRDEKERARLEQAEAVRVADEETGRRVEQMHEAEKKEWEEKHGEVNILEKSLGGLSGTGSLRLRGTCLEPLISKPEDAVKQSTRADASRAKDATDSDPIQEMRPAYTRVGRSSLTDPLITAGNNPSPRRTPERTTPTASRRESGRSSMDIDRIVFPEDLPPLSSAAPASELIPLALPHLQAEKNVANKPLGNATPIEPWADTDRNWECLGERSPVPTNQEGSATQYHSFSTTRNGSVPDNSPSSASDKASLGTSSLYQPENAHFLESSSKSNRISVATVSGIYESRTPMRSSIERPAKALLESEPRALDTTDSPTSPGTTRDSATLMASSPPSLDSKGILHSTGTLQQNPPSPASSEDRITSVPTPRPEAEDMEDLNQRSKILKVYRTNEWAKHLAQAEQPELEDLEDKHDSAEPSAPLDLDSLQQTTAYKPRPLAQKASTSAPRPTSIPSKGGDVAPLNLNTNNRRLPSSKNIGSSSELSRNTPRKPYLHTRHSSEPPLQSRSPISPTALTHSQSGLSLYQPQKETLLAKRASMVRTRNSIMLDQFRQSSGNPLICEIPDEPRKNAPPMGYPSSTDVRIQSPIYAPSQPPAIPPRSLSRNMMARNPSTNTLHRHSYSLGDEVPLSERKKMLVQSGVQPGLSQSHQRRMSTPVLEEETMRKASDQTEQERRQEARAGRMRERDMLELHREHLRRMQRQASRLL